MASSTTLNVKNLAALGAERLAALLIETSKGNTAAKTRLRLALAEAQGSEDVSREVAKRLTSIAGGRARITWRRRKKLVEDLETQRRAIIEQIAPSDPDQALELAWRFLAIAAPVFERCDDSGGTVIAVFHAALRDLGDIAMKTEADPQALADSVFAALQNNAFGQYDGLIAILAPVLGDDGLARLARRVEELAGEEPQRGATREHARRDEIARRALRDIADARGDVDAFIAQYDARERTIPQIAAEIASRLLEAGRAHDALASIEDTQIKDVRAAPEAWKQMRLAVLEALGRHDEAQALRWRIFEAELSVAYLRAYLKKLPDFDDIEAEERAVAFAATHRDAFSALRFLLEWPALDRAAALIRARRDEIDGDRYDLLTPAAEALAERHPLAATIALRAMVDFTLMRARATRYRHAARHLATCAELAERIADFEGLESHQAYLARLKREHGRKQGFWARTIAQ